MRSPAFESAPGTSDPQHGPHSIPILLDRDRQSDLRRLAPGRVLTLTAPRVLAFRRSRALASERQRSADLDIAIVRGLPQVIAESLRAKRYAAVTAALASAHWQSPLAITAFEDGDAVGWALAHGRSWRFPFMETNDLQFGLVYVDPGHRRSGIGLGLVLDLVVGSAADTGNVWWFCAESNEESVRIAERADFHQVGLVRKAGRIRGYRLTIAKPPTD